MRDRPVPSRHDDELELAPVPPSTPWVKTLDRALVVLCAGGVFLTLISGLFIPTLGGRRSTRLKWEEREKAAREARDRAEALARGEDR